MWHAPQGVHAFLRAYYHLKSADWKENKPYPLAVVDRRASWRRCRPTTSWTCDKDMAETVAHGHAVAGGDRGEHVADGQRAGGLRARSTAAPASRAACSGTAAMTERRDTRRSCSCFPAARSTCRRASSPARATGASTSGPARSSAMQDEACTNMSRRATWSTAPGTGCSRSSRRRSARAAGLPETRSLSRYERCFARGRF